MVQKQKEKPEEAGYSPQLEKAYETAEKFYLKMSPRDIMIIQDKLKTAMDAFKLKSFEKYDMKDGIFDKNMFLNVMAVQTALIVQKGAELEADGRYGAKTDGQIKLISTPNKQLISKAKEVSPKETVQYKLTIEVIGKGEIEVVSNKKYNPNDPALKRQVAAAIEEQFGKLDMGVIQLNLKKQEKI